MGIWKRLKRLWRLSNTEGFIAEHKFYGGSTELELEIQRDKPFGQALIVPDEPLDIFPSETNEEEPHDKTS